MRRWWQDPLHRLAFRNCLRNWRYSLATVLTLSLGLLSLWSFRGYMQGVATMYQEHFRARHMLGDVLIETKRAETDGIWEGALNEAEQASIKLFLQAESKRVDGVLRFLGIEGEVSQGTETSIFNGLAYDRDPGTVMRGKKWSWNAVAGRPLGQAQEVILGKSLSASIGCSVPEQNYLQKVGTAAAYIAEERPFSCPMTTAMLQVATETGQVNASHFKVAGIMDAGFHDQDRTWLMLDLADAQTLLDTKRVSWFSLHLSDTADREALVRDFKQKFAGSTLLAIPWDLHRFSELYRRTMSLLGVFEIFVSLILSGIISMTIFNLLVKIIQERMKEIGLLRTLGFSPGQIQRLFIEEALIAVSLGIALGTLLTLALAFLANGLGIPYKAGILSEPVPFVIQLSWSIWSTSAAMLAALALLATVLASMRAMKRSIVDCFIQV